MNLCRTHTFWKDYFTSSKDVAQYRITHGEPDVIQVRKIFTDPQDAIDFEVKVLTKLLSDNNPKRSMWINHCVHFLNYVSTPENRKKLSIAKRKYLANRTPEQIERDYQVRLMNAGNKEANRKISESHKKRFADPEYYKWFQENVWNNPKYYEERSKRTTEKHADAEYHAKWLKIMQSDEYREKQGRDSKKRFEDPDYYIKKSLNAKKSTGTRLATKTLNSLDDHTVLKISDEQYIELLKLNIKPEYGFDDEKVLKKLHDKRKKLLKEMELKEE